jgi:hypothetical protein
LIYHRSDWKRPGFEKRIQEAFEKYRETLSDDHKALLDHYEIKDIGGLSLIVGFFPFKLTNFGKSSSMTSRNLAFEIRFRSPF